MFALRPVSGGEWVRSYLEGGIEGRGNGKGDGAVKGLELDDWGREWKLLQGWCR